MKNKVTTGLLLFYAMSLLIACSPKKPEPVVIDTDQIKKEIQAKEDEFAATYNSGEVKNIGYYAEDAISFSQNKAPLTGRAAIVEFLKAGFYKSTKLSFITNEVYVTNEGNQVLEIGKYTVADSTNTTINTGNYMSLFVKRDGKYVCLRDMSTSDRPIE
ncbi:MAG: nuclear transport factor 2 family protein [Bacteroidota bacterium]